MQVKKGQAKGHEKKKDLVEEQQQEEPKTAELQVQEYVFNGQTPRSMHLKRTG